MKRIDFFERLRKSFCPFLVRPVGNRAQRSKNGDEGRGQRKGRSNTNEANHSGNLIAEDL